MSQKKLVPFNFGFQTSPTPLHDGTNAGQPPKSVPGFIIQAVAETIIEGLVIKANATASWAAFTSRGTYDNYDLTQINYTGGPFVLTVETEV